MTADVRNSAGCEFENSHARAHVPLLLGFDDLIDRGDAAATGLPGHAGANDIVAAARAIAKHLADRAIADTVALADDHLGFFPSSKRAQRLCGALSIHRSYHYENEVQYHFSRDIRLQRIAQLAEKFISILFQILMGLVAYLRACGRDLSGTASSNDPICHARERRFRSLVRVGRPEVRGPELRAW